jgi:hypothetical protein
MTKSKEIKKNIRKEAKMEMSLLRKGNKEGKKR